MKKPAAAKIMKKKKKRSVAKIMKTRPPAMKSAKRMAQHRAMKARLQKRRSQWNVKSRARKAARQGVPYAPQKHEALARAICNVKKTARTACDIAGNAKTQAEEAAAQATQAQLTAAKALRRNLRVEAAVWQSQEDSKKALEISTHNHERLNLLTYTNTLVPEQGGMHLVAA